MIFLKLFLICTFKDPKLAEHLTNLADVFLRIKVHIFQVCLLSGGTCGSHRLGMLCVFLVCRVSLPVVVFACPIGTALFEPSKPQ